MKNFAVSENFASVNMDVNSGNRVSIKEKKEGKSFTDHLVEAYQNVNKMNVTADKMATNLSTGKTENIHETMLAISQAEIGFKLMVQVRNKALEAYQEIMRMQI